MSRPLRVEGDTEILKHKSHLLGKQEFQSFVVVHWQGFNYFAMIDSFNRHPAWAVVGVRGRRS
jgi:hypothetical protein